MTIRTNPLGLYDWTKNELGLVVPNASDAPAHTVIEGQPKPCSLEEVERSLREINRLQRLQPAESQFVFGAFLQLRPRRPTREDFHLCALHGDCLEHEAMAHACWIQQWEAANR